MELSEECKRYLYINFICILNDIIDLDKSKKLHISG